MSLRPFVLGIEGLRLTANEKAIFRAAPPSGIILFLRNVDHPEQLAALMEEINEVSDGQTLLYIDQEGGRVQRLAPPFWPQYPIANDYRALEGEAFEKAIYAHHRLIADDLAKAGFDINCAPCLDLKCDITASFLQDRAFGYQADRVIMAGKTALRAFDDAGILGVIKHIPGHGRATVDSHLHLPEVQFPTDPYGEPIPQDAAIFREFADAPLAMSAHILYPQIDAMNPLTLSPKGVAYVREIVGFRGVLLSDDIFMRALSGRQDEIARRAFDAGVDLVVACSGIFEDIQAIYAQPFEMPEPLLTQHQDWLALRRNRAESFLEDAARQDLFAQLALD